MKKMFILLFLLHFANTICQAQHIWSTSTTAFYDWHRTHGIATDNSGNVYTVNTFQNTFDADPGSGITNLVSVGSYDVYLSKYDANGNLIWAKSFGGTGEEDAYTIAADASGNIYIGGAFQRSVDFDPGPGITSLTADNNALYSGISDGFISKFNANGDFVWSRSIGSSDLNPSHESIMDLALDNAGNIYAAGKFKSGYQNYAIDLDPGPGVLLLPGWSGYTRGFVLKLDANGNFVNGGGINVGSNRSVPAGMVVKDNFVYIASNSNDDVDPTQSGYSAINKYDLNLNQIWTEPLGDYINVTAMDIDNQANIYLGGDFFSTVDFNPGPAVYNITANDDDMFVCKLDNSGVFQWAKGFAQVQASLYSLKVNPQSGDCFLGGYIFGSGYFAEADPSSYVTGVSVRTGFVDQIDASGNFKTIYPLLATGTGSASDNAEPCSLFFDQSSSDLFIQGYFSGDVDFDPSPQNVYLMNLPDGGTFLSKWEIKTGINYYNTKANLGLENLNTWSSTPDGTGPSPQNFTDGAHFNVINQTNAVLSGVVHIAGFDSKLIIGDGINPMILTVVPGNSYIDHTTIVEVMNNASLILQNDVVPALQKAFNGSYVEFAQTGTSTLDSILIPAIQYYDLKLTGGLKSFQQETTTVANNFIADGVANLGGTKIPDYANKFCYLECLGNLTFLNGTAFEPESVAASQRRFALKMNGVGPVQTITGNGTDIMLVGLVRTAPSACNIVLSPGTNLYLGSAYGGGLKIKPANATLSCNGGSINFRNTCWLSSYSDSGYINSNGTSFNMSGHTQYNYYFSLSAANQTLRFVPGSTINNLSIFCPLINDYYNDMMHITGNITVTGQVSMASGFIDLPIGTTISLANTATLNPAYSGSNASFIQGTVSKTGSSDFYFPLGNLSPSVYVNNNYQYLTKFAPVALSSLSSSNTYTVLYKKENYPVHTIAPATLQVNPGYGVSGVEYWDITPAIPGGTTSIRFYYKDANSQILDPLAVSIAHFDGTDWNDIGGTPNVANNASAGDVFVAGVSTFSPFTFGGTANVVVPVTLTSFSARKQSTSVQLSWTTEQEIDTKSFIIERSTDQRAWTEITRMNAAGNSAHKINYTTTDFNPAKGVNYYRLKQLDLDGTGNYSQTRSLYFGNDVDIALVPNPAVDKVTVYLPGNSAGAIIRLFNVDGQLMKTISTSYESVQINLNGFSKGMYTMKIVGKNFSGIRQLLVK